MPRPLVLLLLLIPPIYAVAPLFAQDLKPLPLQLPHEDAAIKIAPTAPGQPDPAKQLAELVRRTDAGDKDAAFQVGTVYLLGQAVPQNAATAEQYFSKAEMTPTRMCFVTEAYFESSVPTRVEAAKRWALAASSACGYWELAHWSRRNMEEPAQELAYLEHGLTAPDDGLRPVIQARLGELELESIGKRVSASAADRLVWIGAAARQRVAQAQLSIAYSFARNADPAASPTVSLDWVRKAAKYGNPNAMAMLGQAVMSREISDLTFRDGTAFYDLGARQDILTAVGEEFQRRQLEPEQLEELLNAEAAWQRVAREAGAYYAKDDPLRFTPVEAGAAVDTTALLSAATPENPDAELRLAYLYESRNDLDRAETLYREVWAHGPAHLWNALAEEAAKSGKWVLAEDRYSNAAALGSRPACAALARIHAEGLQEKSAGKSDPVGAYLWLLRSESSDSALLATRKKALTAEQAKDVELSQARWLLEHQEYWKGDIQAAQALVAAGKPEFRMQMNGQFVSPPKRDSPEELLRKADAGDRDAAYLYAVDMLFGKDEGITEAQLIQAIEHYAKMGAREPEQRARIASGYSSAPSLSPANRRKYAIQWWVTVGPIRSAYELGKVYNGKSDGFVKTDDEKMAVAYWERAVNSAEQAAGKPGGEPNPERWARLARMELGYRVVKPQSGPGAEGWAVGVGWSSGNKARDAAWAHELALEMLGKELFQIAGEYSYGHELAHDQKTYLHLVQRAAIYNIDNAQGQLAQAILGGDTHYGDAIDAYAWVKLRSIKQDTEDSKVVAQAEEDPEIRRKVEDRFAQLLKTRIESGAYFPQGDPLRTASAADLEARVAQFEPEAQMRLAQILEQQGTDASLTRAIALYRRVWANAGQEVRLDWGRTLMYGVEDVPRDDVGAEKWLWDAANAGSHPACRLLATIYGEGRGFPVDLAAAEAWRELAGDPANRALAPDQRVAVAEKVADWASKHSGW